MVNKYNMENKFGARAWDGEKMHYNDFLLSPDNGDILALDTHPFKVMDWELQRWTKVRDKNNKKVYVGDIVECTTYKTNNKKRVEEKFLSLVWEDEDVSGGDYVSYMSKIKGREEYFETGDTLGMYDKELGSRKGQFPNASCKVIGNKYENPELLKKLNILHSNE